MLLNPLESYFDDGCDDDCSGETPDPIAPSIEVDLTGRELLTHFELLFLVNGLRAVWSNERYMKVTVRAHRGVCSQLGLLLRWHGRWEWHHRGMSDHNPQLRKLPDIITVIEIPIE